MKRRNFIQSIAAGSSILAADPEISNKAIAEKKPEIKSEPEVITADVVIAGGGLGGCAAALASLRNNLSVILTEETDWIGGQISQQGVPPDEHQWIETHGAPKAYRDFRNAIRQYYIRNYPLTEAAKSNKYLNPGNGSVSK